MIGHMAPMTKTKLTFKNKVLIPLIITFSLSTLIISWNFYNALETSIIYTTNESLNIFTDSILTQVMHLDLILETTTETLARNHLSIAMALAYALEQEGVDTSSEALTMLSELIGINEFSVADRYGVIIYSNIPEYIGFYYGSTEQTAIYMPLADGTTTVLQEPPRRSVLDDQVLGDIRHYTGIAREGGGFIQFGFNADILLRLQEEINIERTINETTLGVSGYGFVVRYGVIIAHPNEEMSGRDVSGEEWYDQVASGDGFAWIYINGGRYYAGFKSAGGHTVVGLIPQADYYAVLNQSFVNAVLVFFVALAALIIVVYLLINFLLRPVKTLTAGLGEIAKGNLDTRIEGKYNDEFALIKDAVNKMASDLTAYLDGKSEAERLARETDVAMKQLAVENATLDRLNSLKSKFLADISHELRTPLTVIDNYAQLTDMEIDAGLISDDTKKNLLTVSSEAQRLAHLADRLLDITVARDSMEMGIEVYVEDIFSRALALCEPVLAANRNRLDIQIEKNCPTVRTIPDMLIQVLFNLIGNANRHTKEGEIRLTAKQNDRMVVFVVKDNGAGILPDMLAKVFQRGASGDGSSGLGLNICKEAIESHGGTISVESEPGIGTIVTFALPIYTENVEE
ncbi:MAG: ATP-binding protein [Oscillospiraceae bacterium]|nr:ATP-binding protein [Oscillospiraceae bacterium]